MDDEQAGEIVGIACGSVLAIPLGFLALALSIVLLRTIAPLLFELEKLIATVCYAGYAGTVAVATSPWLGPTALVVAHITLGCLVGFFFGLRAQKPARKV